MSGAGREYSEAIEWLRSLLQEGGFSHHMIPDSGVIVVDIERPLRAQDFDAMAGTADPWIDAHGELDGIVVHARKLPRWESVGSLCDTCDS